MNRPACLFVLLGLFVPGMYAEIRGTDDTVAGKTAHAASSAGNGIKQGAQKTGEAVSGAASATAHGASAGAKAAGRGVVRGTLGLVHAAGRGIEKTGGAIANAGR